ncbi:MAG: L-threonylcarbamoyladenylate synthase [Chloroflexota bacterium]|nr:L-threonylcarbamoyladenylate synthase [Chloroflexota bacterium]
MTHTRILTTEDPQAISKAVKTIKCGGTIAFPTDTVYGLAVDPFNSQALNRIYAIKERSIEKAIPVLIGDFQQIEMLVLEVIEPARKLADAFWPGPLTLILPKAADIPEELSPYPTIGIRMPNHEFTLRLLQATGPLATTSANISGDSNPTTSEDVIKQIGGRIDLLIDGGKTPGAVPSTVIDLTGKPLKLLREGPISRTDLCALLNEDVV